MFTVIFLLAFEKPPYFQGGENSFCQSLGREESTSSAGCWLSSQQAFIFLRLLNPPSALMELGLIQLFARVQHCSTLILWKLFLSLSGKQHILHVLLCAVVSEWWLVSLYRWCSRGHPFQGLHPATSQGKHRSPCQRDQGSVRGTGLTQAGTGMLEQHSALNPARAWLENMRPMEREGSQRTNGEKR